jgi:ADP-heptose:LPS heptosyltransferase
MSASISSVSPRERRPRILVIRRDNIGDLVCTTPLLAALRGRYPSGHIAALVNTYNRAVLDGNPDVDAVYAYEKGKHRGAGKSILSTYAERVRLILALRRERFDYAILATPGFAALALRFARLAGARHVLGYADPDGAHPRLDIALTYDSASKAHEVEQVFGLLKALGINGAPSATRVFTDPGLRADPERALSRLGSGTPVVGVHISARRRNQQWPAENFAALIRAIAQRHAAKILLLWSPGEADNPMHPGDDDKAQAVVERCGGLPLLPWPTQALPRLIAALSVCDYVVCTDGGAMHLAAALGKPILCFFGDSPPERWRPWMTSHELLQPPSRELRDLSVEEALAGFERLVRSAPFSSRA